MLCVTLQGDRGAVSGLLAIAAAEPDGAVGAPAASAAASVWLRTNEDSSCGRSEPTSSAVASDLVLPAVRIDDAVLRASLDAIISTDAQGVVLEFNPAAEVMFGYARDDVIGADMAELVIPPAQREAHRRGMRRLLEGDEARILEQRIELEAQRADGSLLPVELAIARIAGCGPTATYAGFVRDLTAIRRAERERHERIARQALVVALGQTALTGVELAELGDAGLLFVQGMRSMLCVTLQGDRGAVSGLLAIAAAEPDALRTDDIGFAQAIANVVGTAVARWRADEEVARLGLHDPLTGLPNRPLFENRLEQALDRSRRDLGEAGLLLVDLDGFGKLNEAYGHRTGDEVLVGAAARLGGVLPADATAGRLAGDHFGVLVPEARGDGELLDLAREINLALREPMLAGGRELTISASIGTVMTERGVGTVAELVRTASAAATRARERGGGRAEPATQGMRRRLVHAAEIEQGLRRALTDGELRLHYQPIVDLHAGAIVAVEAFVRWQHPDHGLLAPGQFLSAAEATGLAVPLGAEILSIACRELAEWETALGADRAIAVHVNVSALHFAAPDLAATVSRALQRSGLAPDKLVLEIAETMFTGEGHGAMAQLDDLRGVGVRIALDRFGTGYSSLAAIRRLPFDALKVDSSFLTELGHSPRDAALVEAMIGIGHSLGLPMTAAKVETEEQLRLLRSLGMDGAQGDLFAPPLSATAALELVRSERVWSGLLDATRPPARSDVAVASPAPAQPNGAPQDAPAGAPAPVGALSLGQAAQALGISTTTARRWANEGRLGATRTAGGHRRFAASDVRRLLAERGRPAITPAEPPRRPLPTLATLAEEHGSQLAELSWRGLYGEPPGGFFVGADGLAAADRWLGAIASAAETANYEMLHEATRALMRSAERAGASLLERHLAIERFAETATRALTRRGCPRDEIVDIRRLFAALDQRQLADAG
ncbi:MAG TPA: EAL domain-containing protein, partial [Solirubrobacteraceae bacterium]|nr:EAL domain-containing protein [Solirubrobacteraceae bacterium]